ncbi:ABC transporter substrate-binding protein [Nonlabens antarcticus]|uniref:ABC transporter substrate-binding protein n=1 Tax=Nonlabens antarcticus TaxID=392714 RepID=UPI0018911059|nr:helical backbone metal receptor [Nonlabens antarcticus]
MAVEITDQCGRIVRLSSSPQRIITLVPSQTELLYDLGLEDKIVGVTRFCVHPERAVKEKRVVGGTKKIVEKRIKELQPDLIICNKEENTKQIVDFCESIASTYVSDISTLEDSLEMIEQVGTLTQTRKQADEITAKIKLAFQDLPNPKLKNRALYLIWKDPYMSVGNDTFIHNMLEKAGFDNVLKNQTRYPQLNIQEVLNLAPDVILLSSEPYNFKVEDGMELCSAFAKANKKQPVCTIVDGEIFSWYGSRLLKTPDYLIELNKRTGT